MFVERSLWCVVLKRADAYHKGVHAKLTWRAHYWYGDKRSKRWLVRDDLDKAVTAFALEVVLC